MAASPNDFSATIEENSNLAARNRQLEEENKQLKQKNLELEGRLLVCTEADPTMNEEQ